MIKLPQIANYPKSMISVMCDVVLRDILRDHARLGSREKSHLARLVLQECRSFHDVVVLFAIQDSIFRLPEVGSATSLVRVNRRVFIISPQ